MAGPLDGVRVLDLSWGIAGPLGVLLLAEHGADVIKVEPPGGDPFRVYDGARVWNRSRRSITVDLKHDDGRDVMRKLLASADVVVESFRPGVMDRLGFGYESVHAEFPRVIYLSVPAYPEGHRMAKRPGYDALVQASSGQMWEQPGWRMGPIFLHMPMPSMGAFFLVSIGITTALFARERTGEGQHVETSLFQGALLYTTQIWQHLEKSNAATHELMGKTYPPGVHQPMIFECANDQWIHVSVMSGLPPLKPMDEILGLEDAPDAMTFLTLPPEEREKFTVARRAKFKVWDRDELVAAFLANNHAAEAIIPMEEAFAHPQVIANDMVATVDDPDLGPTTQMGVPIHMLGTPGAIQGPQPRAGEHTAEILAELGYSKSDVDRLTAAGARGRRLQVFALEDVTLLDFGQYLAGPFGPMLIGDLGADVIKVEPVTGDGMRMATKPFFGCQRGKRDIALNIKTPAGLEIAHQLIARADVVHHNMTRGVATKLGIDYASCRALRADTIYCNTYAYGLEDPLGKFGGLDPLYQAAAGLEYEAGATAEGNSPLYYRFGMCDASNALLSIVGVLMALYHRARTGEGQELWTSLLDGGVIFSSDSFLVNGKSWDRPRLDRDQTGLSALYRLYRTQDDDWIMVAAVKDSEWDALCRTLHVEHLLDDARFATPAARHEHRRQLASLLEPVFLTRTARFWSRTLDDVDVPNEIPIDTWDGEQVLYDADNERLGLVTEYVHPLVGVMRQFGDLVRFSETPGHIGGPPPLVGQDTREIMHELGYRDGDIDALNGEGVIYVADDAYTTRFSN